MQHKLLISCEFSAVYRFSSTNLQAICWSNLLINGSASLVSLYVWIFSFVFLLTSAHLSLAASDYLASIIFGWMGKNCLNKYSWWSWIADKSALKKGREKKTALKFKLNSLTFLLINVLNISPKFEHMFRITIYILCARWFT